jgi:hypothetical protein
MTSVADGRAARMAGQISPRSHAAASAFAK